MAAPHSRRDATPCCGVGLLLSLAVASSGFGAGFDSIERADLEAHVRRLAAPELEGRDSPSLGLDRAAAYLERRFAEAGLEPVSELAGDSYLLPFERRMRRPVVVAAPPR